MPQRQLCQNSGNPSKKGPHAPVLAVRPSQVARGNDVPQGSHLHPRHHTKIYHHCGVPHAVDHHVLGAQVVMAEALLTAKQGICSKAEQGEAKQSKEAQSRAEHRAWEMDDEAGAYSSAQRCSKTKEAPRRTTAAPAPKRERRVAKAQNRRRGITRVGVVVRRRLQTPARPGGWSAKGLQQGRRHALYGMLETEPSRELQ